MLSVPALPPEPREAIALVAEMHEETPFSGIIGSSLGGYYSMYLHRKYGLPAALVNPAAKPFELLVDYIGINTNMYTGEQYEIKAEHMEQLLELQVDRSDLVLSRLFLLTESDDETLDYRQAAEKLVGAKMYLSRGGDHSYTHFSAHLPAIKNFFDGILLKS